MTDAERHCLAKHRAGLVLMPADTVLTISDLAELDAYEAGLKGRGALDSDALAAISQRRAMLKRGRA